MACSKCKSQLNNVGQVTDIYRKEPFDNGLMKTPPMGWNTWNYFKYDINEEMLLKMAKSLKEKGLLDAGYAYFNLDDYWEADIRTKEGKLESDPVRFPNGMKHFVDKCNELGFRVGIYSSNGVKTCQGLPASLGNEYNDARQFVKWGIEYLKYDFCYHKISSSVGPQIFSISLCKEGTNKEVFIMPDKAQLSGTAKLKFGKNNFHGSMEDHNDKRWFITGLDKNKGAAKFLYQAEEEGDYYLSLDTRYPFLFATTKKEVMVAVRIDDKTYFAEPGAFRKPCRVPQIRLKVKLKKGNNIITVFNPIGSTADSIMLNYQTMSDALIDAVRDISEETGSKQKPIAYSLCCWGRGKPWKWGPSISNLWRTTGDIQWNWRSIMFLYEINVRLYKYASVGHWNDPDMLEVGNGKLTLDENKAHFSLWCMMASPLLLGNDVVNMKQEHFDIITNKNLIAVDQDALGKQAKRINFGKVDVLVRPLADKSIAICFLNKRKKPVSYSFDLKTLKGEEYVRDFAKDKYDAVDLWSNQEKSGVDNLVVEIPAHGVKVFKLK